MSSLKRKLTRNIQRTGSDHWIRERKPADRLFKIKRNHQPSQHFLGSQSIKRRSKKHPIRAPCRSTRRAMQPCAHACMHALAERARPAGSYCADGSSRPTPANPAKDSRAQGRPGEKKKGTRPAASRPGGARRGGQTPARPAPRGHARLWKKLGTNEASSC